MGNKCHIIGEYDAVYRRFVFQKIIKLFSNIKYDDDDGKKQYGNHECGKKLFGDIFIQLFQINYRFWVITGNIAAFQSIKSPSKICFRAFRTSQR